MPTMQRARFACAAVCLGAAAFASAQDMGHHGMGHSMGHSTDHAAAAPAAFVASSDRPFARLMDDAMAVMARDMAAAPMNGQPGHDFVAMMLPHHQGAVDMAKAVLLNTQDPELRNLALGIIAEQQNEINVMQAWLARHPDHKETP
jgi:uncharacterized protein (DUF305 family)